MRRQDSAPDIVALVVLTAALLWMMPVLARHPDWLPFHTEWSIQRPSLERAAGVPMLPLQ